MTDPRLVSFFAQIQTVGLDALQTKMLAAIEDGHGTLIQPTAILGMSRPASHQFECDLFGVSATGMSLQELAHNWRNRADEARREFLQERRKTSEAETLMRGVVETGANTAAKHFKTHRVDALAIALTHIVRELRDLSPDAASQLLEATIDIEAGIEAVQDQAPDPAGLAEIRNDALTALRAACVLSKPQMQDAAA